MNHMVRVSWTIKQGPKVWVHMWRAKYEEDHQSNLVKIRSLIGKIAGLEAAAAAHISAPVAAEHLREKLPLPWHFLMSNIPQGLADFLGQQVVISTPEATCFFLPFKPPLQTYICTLENFALPCTAEANIAVANLIKSTLLGDHETISFVEERLKHPIPGAVERALHSIYAQNFSIALLSTKKKTLWNIYCRIPPDLSLSNFLTWANKIRSTEFISEDYGRGTTHMGEKQ